MLEPRVHIKFKNEYKQFKDKHTKAIALGVVICVCAPIVLLLSVVLVGERFLSFGLFLFLCFVALAVFLFTYYGLQNSAFKTLLTGSENYEKQMQQPKKKKKSVTDTVAEVVFPLATLIYLFCGFIGDAWGVAWVIFPFVGIVFGIFETLYKSFHSSKKTY